MLDEEREPAVSSTLQLDTQLLEEHLINVTPESEVYRFGNGGLSTSTERVTVPVVLADHPLLLSYSVVESPVLSLLTGRDVVEGLRLDVKGGIKGSSKNPGTQWSITTIGRFGCWTLLCDSVA